MADQPVVLVGIAAYNEVEALPGVLKRIPSCLTVDGTEWKIQTLVIDDGSTDGTAQAVQEAGFEVITPHHFNRGKTACMRHAFNRVCDNGFAACITMDADGQHDPAYLKQLLEELRDHDVVLTSRYHRDSPRLSLPPMDRALMNIAFASLIRKMTGMAVTDPACGFRAFRRNVLTRLDLTREGYGLEIECIIKLWRMGDIRWKELPVPMIYNGTGKVGRIYDADNLPQRLDRWKVHATDILEVLLQEGVSVEDVMDAIHKQV